MPETILAKLSKDEAKEIVSNKGRPEQSKLRSRIESNREKSQQNRFKIEESPTASATKKVTIVDVEKESAVAAASSSQPSTSTYSENEPYVYDIYIADSANATNYPDSIDLNDLRLVLMDDVYCSYYAYM